MSPRGRVGVWAASLRVLAPKDCELKLDMFLSTRRLAASIRTDDP